MLDTVFDGKGIQLKALRVSSDHFSGKLCQLGVLEKVPTVSLDGNILAKWKKEQNNNNNKSKSSVRVQQRMIKLYIHPGDGPRRTSGFRGRAEKAAALALSRMHKTPDPKEQQRLFTPVQRNSAHWSVVIKFYRGHLWKVKLKKNIRRKKIER